MELCLLSQLTEPFEEADGDKHEGGQRTELRTAMLYYYKLDKTPA
jgi:hypothetical protein